MNKKVLIISGALFVAILCGLISTANARVSEKTTNGDKCYVCVTDYGTAGDPSDAIIGEWLTSKKDSKIKISKDCDGLYTGVIVWAQSPHQSYEGTSIMKDVSYNTQKGTYSCPWIFDPRLKIVARATMNVHGDTLHVTAKKGILSKNEIFTRVKSH